MWVSTSYTDIIRTELDEKISSLFLLYKLALHREIDASRFGDKSFHITQCNAGSWRLNPSRGFSCSSRNHQTSVYSARYASVTTSSRRGWNATLMRLWRTLIARGTLLRLHRTRLVSMQVPRAWNRIHERAHKIFVVIPRWHATAHGRLVRRGPAALFSNVARGSLPSPPPRRRRS